MIDASIPLQVQVPDIGKAVGLYYDTLNRNKQMKMLEENSLLKNQLTQSQLEGNEIKNQGERSDQIIKSLAAFSTQVQPLIQSNDLPSMIELTKNRIAEIDASKGLAGNSDDSREFLAMLTDPNIPDQQKIAQASDLSNKAISAAQNMGLFGGSDQTASMQNSIYYDNLIASGDTEGAQRFGKMAGMFPKTSPEQELALITATAEAKLKASRTSEIRQEFSERARIASRGEITLNQAAAAIKNGATQGYAGQAKVALSKIFPEIDVTNEANLSQAFGLLTIQTLESFKGPTTDFEYEKSADLNGSLGDGESANTARLNSLKRNNWFVKRETQQFNRWVKDSKNDPDLFAFNMDEKIKTKKGEISLQDIQDTALTFNRTIEEQIREFNR